MAPASMYGKRESNYDCDRVMSKLCLEYCGCFYIQVYTVYILYIQVCIVSQGHIFQRRYNKVMITDYIIISHYLANAKVSSPFVISFSRCVRPYIRLSHVYGHFLCRYLKGVDRGSVISR